MKLFMWLLSPFKIVFDNIAAALSGAMKKTGVKFDVEDK